jgi:hypothetical protein
MGMVGTTGRDGGQDSQRGVKAPIRSRPSDRLVRVWGRGPSRQISGKAQGQSQMESQARLGPRHIDTPPSVLWNTRGQHWGYPQHPQESTPSPRAPLPSYYHQ